MKTTIQIIFAGILFSSSILLRAQSTMQDYVHFDFVPGEKILLDDHLLIDKTGSPPAMWIVEGGKAIVTLEGDEPCISILEYYTKLTPNIKSMKSLPDTFTIEYDTWLDAGYDGNPGVEIHLVKGEQEVVITPNKHLLTVSFPTGIEAKDNPEEYFGENKFYNRWVHISISYIQSQIIVYIDQHKQITVTDCGFKPSKVLVTGNTSGDLKILLKNFKLAKSIPPKTFELKNGKFITHAIKFDVGKATLKPESMGTIQGIVKYLNSNPSTYFEIGGHTDSDGEEKDNLTLSEERADAVKKILVSLGVNEAQLSTKGYGETSPIDPNTTPEGKANNRRVEFTQL